MRKILLTVVSGVFLLMAALVPTLSAAADDVVYGWQLMTQQERNEYQAQMRALNTEQEREKFQLEHHERMKERAKAQGVTLPEEPRSGHGSPGAGGGQGRGPGH